MSYRARLALFAALAILATLSLLLIAAVRERNALPGAANRLLQATTESGAVTTCLGGVQDELYVAGGRRLNTPVARHAALSRLRLCDVRPLEKAVAAVDLPPQAPVDQSTRRKAYSRVAQGVTTLRRVVRDVRGARQAMAEDVTNRRVGRTIVLAYRSASQGSDTAYALALKALALLNETPGTTPPPTN